MSKRHIITQKLRAHLTENEDERKKMVIPGEKLLNLHVVRNEVKAWEGSSVEDLGSILKSHGKKVGVVTYVCKSSPREYM